jgi:GDP-L-fucose synthase
MLTNFYGINEIFDLETSYVMPTLIRKLHEEKINNEKEVVM